MIDWSAINEEDTELISKIAKRAIISFPVLNYMDITMDITATHINNPLNLEQLSAFDAFNFSHDIIGINNNLNRNTGKLQDCFLPRCSC